MDLPRVTEILKSVGLINTDWFTDEARTRGEYVHLACAYLDEGTLDVASLDPQIEGYVRAYDAWRRASGIGKIQWIETTLTDPQGRYRGTPDRVLITRPRNLVDIKSGQPMAFHKWQLSAYVSMLPDPYSYERMGVYLKNDGTYSVKVFPKADYQKDLAVFLSALNVFYAKREMENRNGNRSETA